MCPRSSDPIYVVNYYVKWVTTSWTYCITLRNTSVSTVCPGRSDPFYIASLIYKMGHYLLCKMGHYFLDILYYEIQTQLLILFDIKILLFNYTNQVHLNFVENPLFCLIFLLQNLYLLIFYLYGVGIPGSALNPTHNVFASPIGKSQNIIYIFYIFISYCCL